MRERWRIFLPFNVCQKESPTGFSTQNYIFMHFIFIICCQIDFFIPLVLPYFKGELRLLMSIQYVCATVCVYVCVCVSA